MKYFLFAVILSLVTAISFADFEHEKWHTGIWNFAKVPNLQGWKTTAQDASLDITSQGLRLKFGSNEKHTWLVSPKHTFTPFTTDYICAKMRPSRDANVHIAFRTEKLYEWSSDKRTESVHVPADGKFHEIQFDMKKNEKWNAQNGWAINIAFVISPVEENKNSDKNEVIFEWVRAQTLPFDKWSPELWAKQPRDGILKLEKMLFDNRPFEYTDKETGNIVRVLTNLPGNCHCHYHYYKCFNRDGGWMTFSFSGEGDKRQYTGLYNLELATGKIERLTGPRRGKYVITPDGQKIVYYSKRNSINNKDVTSLWVLDLETKYRRHIWDFPEKVGLLDFSVTTDGRYAVMQSFRQYQPTKDELAAMSKMPPREAAMESVFLRNQSRPRYWNMRINLNNKTTGQINIIDHPTMHNQCSPTVPEVMLVQFQSWVAQPFWLVDIFTGQVKPLMDYDQWSRNYRDFIFGHPCWSLDGNSVWCEARQWIDQWEEQTEKIYRTEKWFWTNEKRWNICRIDVETGKIKIWPLEDFHGWSVHYAPTPWENIILSDGHDMKRYISIINLESDIARISKLCAVPHDYRDFEPSCHLSPDCRHVIFNTKIEGKVCVCAVKIPEELMPADNISYIGE